MKKNATITSILILGCALGAFSESMKLPFGGWSSPAAGFFPAVLAVLLAITSLLAVVYTLTGGEKEEALLERLTWKKIVLTVGALFTFAFFLEHVGYLLTTFLLVMFSLRAVERASWRLAVGVGISASVISYLIFGWLLGSSLPAGLLRI